MGIGWQKAYTHRRKAHYGDGNHEYRFTAYAIAYRAEKGGPDGAALPFQRQRSPGSLKARH